MTALWLRKYDGFNFSRDHTIEVSGDFLGGPPHLIQHPNKFWGVVGLVSVKIKRFDMTRDHVIDVSRDFVGEVLSS